MAGQPPTVCVSEYICEVNSLLKSENNGSPFSLLIILPVSQLVLLY